jgi:hypothetical protein
LVSASSSGAAVVFLWGPEADGDGTRRAYMWTEANKATGGKPSPLAASLFQFAQIFGPTSAPNPGATVAIDRRAPYQIRYSA